jgi:elongation factor 1-delta
LAGEVAKARQLLIESRDSFKDTPASGSQSIDTGAIKFFEKKAVEFEKSINTILNKIQQLELRISNIEKNAASPLKPVQEVTVTSSAKPVEDDVDLFGSDSDEENEAAAKVREERLAAYNAKKSKKPALIAKSNVILDVKPWDDETDMKELENQVRKISSDGLLWGAAKLVPLAYGIHKLQISCVVEDEKISIDWLQDEITAIEDYVQSVDIAAFNKI